MFKKGGKTIKGLKPKQETKTKTKTKSKSKRGGSWSNPRLQKYNKLGRRIRNF